MGLNRWKADTIVNGPCGTKRMKLKATAATKEEAALKIVDLALMEYENQTRQSTHAGNVNIMQLNHSW